ncbi:hypothetical protein MNR01_16560 [Lysobacter sp. S4-A87]|uniref:hypothetical protein n=1 Tax=Lysobacter sp. S4-A87 TaxID=2925843 RepID=UPI001F53C78F|nr:hypothetical protein [Lysobacter sp. S4-A87]UNK49314.1 hypothetical protein MNR01_16560 [Lysobacter sp. S4-A87]
MNTRKLLLPSLIAAILASPLALAQQHDAQADAKAKEQAAQAQKADAAQSGKADKAPADANKAGKKDKSKSRPEVEPEEEDER